MNHLSLNRFVYLSFLISIGLFVGCGSSQPTVSVTATQDIHVQPPPVVDTLHAVKPPPVAAIPPGDTARIVNSGPDTLLVVHDKPIVATNNRGDTVKTNPRTGTTTTNITPKPIDTTASVTATVKQPAPEIIHKLTLWQRFKTFWVDVFILFALVGLVVVIVKTGIWKQVSFIAKAVGWVLKFIPK